MADQVTTVGAKDATAADVGIAHGGEQHLEHNSGRPVSWIGVTIAIVGSVVGGVAFVPHPTWWLFWAGVGVFLVGILVLGGARTVSKDWY